MLIVVIFALLNIECLTTLVLAGYTDRRIAAPSTLTPALVPIVRLLLLSSCGRLGTLTAFVVLTATATISISTFGFRLGVVIAFIAPVFLVRAV